MKMSNEVTSKPASYGVPQHYQMPEMPNEYYTKQSYNMGRFQQKPAPPPPPMDRDMNDDFLGKLCILIPSIAGIKPSEMGIPHGGMPPPDRFDRSPHFEKNLKSPPKFDNEFESFEDTFKPMKKQPVPPQPQSNEKIIKNGGIRNQQNLVNDFDNMELPVNRNQPKNNMQEYEAMNFDFNNVNDQNDEPNYADNEEDIDIQVKSPPSNPAQSLPTQQPIDPNVLNVDEIEIKPKQQLTFEQLLEKELGGEAPTVVPDDDRVIRKQPKNKFLKRSQKTALPPKDDGPKKYKYYADHFDKSKKSNNSKSDNEETKPAPTSAPTKQRNEDKSSVISEVHKQPSVKFAEDQVTPDKFNEEAPNSEEKGGNSSHSRRTRKARQPQHDNFSEDIEDSKPSALHKQSSLQEFEELERSVGTSDDYQIVTKKNGGDKKQQKTRHESINNDNAPSFNPNKTFSKQTETPAERQRLSKEKQEFKKIKEKFDADQITFEKQKREFDKLKVEFEKYKDVENK